MMAFQMHIELMCSMCTYQKENKKPTHNGIYLKNYKQSTKLLNS